MAHLIHSNLLNHDNSVMNLSLKGNVSEYHNNGAVAVDMICINTKPNEIAPSSRPGLQAHIEQWVLNNSQTNETSEESQYWLGSSWWSAWNAAVFLDTHANLLL